jgi:hypothetical protein
MDPVEILRHPDVTTLVRHKERIGEDKRVIIFLYNHRTADDTTVIRQAVKQFDEDMNFFKIVRPSESTHRNILQKANPESIFIYNRDDIADQNERTNKNRDSMRALSEKASASPSAIAMAPDAGSSESEEVEPSKVRTLGLYYMVEALKEAHVDTEDIGIYPIKIGLASKNGYTATIGEEITEECINLLGRTKSSVASRTELSSLIASSINNAETGQ